MQDLGFETTVDEESYIVTVEGLGGKLPCEEATLNVGSAGTAARFLTATLGVSEGVFHMDSSEQMKRRPMDPLCPLWQNWGVRSAVKEKMGIFLLR